MSAVRQRVIGTMVVIVLAGLPLSGPLCVALCGPADHAQAEAAGHARDGSPSSCHEPTGDPQVGGVPGHGCRGHDGPANDEAPFVSEARADAGVRVLTHQRGPLMPRLSGLLALPVGAGSGPPADTAPASGTPLVLRI